MNKKIVMVISVLAVIILAVVGIYVFIQQKDQKAQEKAATQWTQNFEKKKYTELVKQVTTDSLKQQGYTKDDFVKKYTNVFGGIGVSKIQISNMKVSDQKLNYQAVFETAIGKTTSFSYSTKLIKQDGTYQIDWKTSLIFPNMKPTDRISFQTTTAIRGDLVDVNGFDLATNKKAFRAGIIPKELGNDSTRTKRIEKIAKFLDVSTESVEQKLAQGWVKDDLFVPIKIVADEDVQKMEGLQYAATTTRYYPLGAAAAHLIGYTGTVTAEDIKKNPALSSDAIIGKTGLERAYDKELRGTDGGSISLVNKDGKVKEVLLESKVKNGEKIRLTIDALMQKRAYEDLEKATGSTVIMEPQNGALMALVSKPSFDPNQMVRGLSQKTYDQYANDPNRPFTNRFTQRYAPGSTMKAITAAIGFDAGTLKADRVRTIDGLQWQKDGSWGNYKITRVTENQKVDYKKALIYSDNIFFAQEGLELGENRLRAGLKKFGFGQDFNLPFAMTPAQISTHKQFKSDILLADTAYGQGQLLMSPIQQAVAYSAFANEGKIVQPHIRVNEKSKTSEAVSKKAVDQVNAALLQVVKNPNGTAHNLASLQLPLAAKTGTAELKLEQGTEGIENSFVFAFNAEKKNYLIVSLVENHKKSGKTATQLIKDLVPEVEKSIETKK